jgi:hypothetical protein
MALRPFILVFTSWALGGSLLPVAADPVPVSAADLRVGFYLLHDVCQQETQVDMLAIIKTTPPDVAAYVKRISHVADDTLATIEGLEKADPSLKIDRNPLPLFEQTVRSDIRADKQHQLLFGTSGPHFARALLVAQIEAAAYILHMAEVLAREDKDAGRAATLQKISTQWLALRTEGFRLLDVNR